MITHSKIAELFRALSANTNKTNIGTNYLLLGQAIQTVFPSPSPLWTKYEALGHQIEQDKYSIEMGKGSEVGAKATSDFKALADAARSYLMHFEPPLPTEVNDRTQQEITHIIEHTYFESTLFKVTKWVLFISLAALLGGSISYAGFSFSLTQSIRAEQEMADNALKKMSDLIKDESGKINTAFADAIKAATEKLSQDEKAAAENLKAAVQKSSGEFNATVTSQAQVVTAVATKAAQDIAATSQTKQQTIDQAAQNDITSLSTQTEQKKTSIDLALQNNVGQLDEALTNKLLALNQKSTEVGKKLDVIASDSEATETQFANQLKQRLASWDQRIDPELARVDTLAKSTADIKSATDALDQKLGALQKSSTAALEVAAKLSSGTTTGDLRWIGAVLEKSAALIVVSVVLSIFSLAFSGGILLCRFRHRQVANAPRDSSA